MLKLTFEAFIAVAESRPDLVKQTFEEWNRSAESENAGDDEVTDNDEVGTEYLAINDNVFPTCINEANKLHTFQDMFTPEETPRIMMKGDIDSVYTFSESLPQIVVACGKNHWTLPSITSSSSADTGSRFAVNSELCENPAFVRGGQTKTIPLNWFPNIKIATVQIGDWGHDMHIQLYYLGVEKYTGNGYFNTVMMAVTNAMFNIARCLSLEYEDQSVLPALRRFENLETIVGRRKWTANKSGVKNRLSPSAMYSLAQGTEKALGMIADNVAEIKFDDPFFNGIQPEDNREKSVDRAQMVKFAKRWQNHFLVTASLAGCKGYFTDRKFQRWIEPSPEKYQLLVVQDPAFQDVVDRLNRQKEDEHDRLIEERDRLIQEQQDERNRPNQAQGNERDEEHEDELEIPQVPDVHYHNATDNLPPCAEFPQAIVTWLSDLNQHISLARDGLMGEVMKDFRQAFQCLDEDGELVDDKSNRWYIDSAYEVLIEGGTNIFPRIAPSKEILKLELRDR